MLLQDLNHVEMISEETHLEGGGLAFALGGSQASGRYSGSGTTLAAASITKMTRHNYLDSAAANVSTSAFGSRDASSSGLALAITG